MKHSALSSLVPALIALISIIFVFPFIALCPALTPASTSSVFSGKKKKKRNSRRLPAATAIGGQWLWGSSPVGDNSEDFSANKD